jgi:hypothetical protein
MTSLASNLKRSDPPTSSGPKAYASNLKPQASNGPKAPDHREVHS